MNRDEITRAVTDVMCDVFDIDEPAEIDGLSADDIEDWDSLSHIRFIVALEKKFGFRFTSAEIEGLRNVGEMIDVIESKAP